MSSSHNVRQLFVQLDGGDLRAATGDEVIAAGLEILNERLNREALFCGTPTAAKEFACLRMGALEHEVFAIMFLDARLRLIEFREMFTGSLTQTSVYPREVVKAALKLNAAAVLLVHNHPSGSPDPSRADEMLTTRLQQALALIDVRIIDHLVVGGGNAVSFAERGLL